MNPDLEQFLNALREGPRDVEDNIQLQFVSAIDYEDDAYSDTVEVLAHSVSNICPTLAVRLALWYLYHDGFDAALAVTMKVLGNRSLEPEAERSRRDSFAAIVEAVQCEIYAVRGMEYDEKDERAEPEEEVKEEKEMEGER